MSDTPQLSPLLACERRQSGGVGDRLLVLPVGQLVQARARCPHSSNMVSGEALMVLRVGGGRGANQGRQHPFQSTEGRKGDITRSDIDQRCSESE